MNLSFIDRELVCSDCRENFIFTAGEQVFFHEKEFKNDPKRCKPCKARRSGLTEQKGAAATSAARTETRTECSECGIETTVPFRPTQGRPVLCRICFQLKGRAPVPAAVMAQATVSALTELSTTSSGAALSADAAVLAAASMAGASAGSSVASAADLASIYALEPLPRVEMPRVDGRCERVQAGLSGAS